MKDLHLIKNSLALRLLKVVFSIYLCITVVITLMQMANEYFLEERFIKESLIVSQAISQDNLVTSIWNFDREQLAATVQGILKQPTIAGITIVDEQKKTLIQQGQILNKNLQPVLLENGQEKSLPYITLFRHSFRLMREQKNIGTVTLYSSNQVVFDKVKYNFLVIIINAIIKTIALWLLFIWAFNKFLTRQLDIFCHAMEEVDIDNQKSCTLNLETFNTYELSRIEYFFNNLLKRIIDSRDKLNELNKTLEEKVINRTQEIQAKNQKLEILNQEKNNFLSMAAHDLKNPLGNINNLSFLIEKTLKAGNDEEKILHYNHLINTSSHNMFEIINNLLDVGRIESGNIEVKLIEINMLSLLDSLLSEHFQAAARKNISLNFEPDHDEYRIISDEFMLSQTLNNLISNAIKYSPLNGIVIVSLIKTPLFIQVAVKDQGQGFSVSDKEKLFTKFCRLNNKPTANEGSTGLGLFIVKKLVDLLEIAIDCDSVEGHGTTFRVDIPLKRES